MPKPADIVHMQTVTTGTGDLTVTAVNGKQSFSGAFSTGAANNFVYYGSNQDAAEWERGEGYCSDANTLVRSAVNANSLGTTAKISFTAGTIDVVNDIPAELQVQKSTTALTTGELLTFDTTDGNVVKSAGDAATVFGNIKQLATTAASGVSEFATTVEASAGTATTVAVTPAGVAAYHAAANIGPTTVAGTLTPASTAIDLGSTGNPYGEIHAESFLVGGQPVGGNFGWTLIARSTFANGSTSLELTGISTSYKEIMTQSTVRTQGAVQNIYVQVSTDGGTNYSSVAYSAMELYGESAVVELQNRTSKGFIRMRHDGSTSANWEMQGFISGLEAGPRTFAMLYNLTGPGAYTWNVAQHNSTIEITAVRFGMSDGGAFSTGNINWYGR
jgi:hypothetical protein